MPRAEKPSPIIMRRRLSCRSARVPAGRLRSRVGRNPVRVTRAMLAADPVFWKMYTPSPKLVRPLPMEEISSPAKRRRNREKLLRDALEEEAAWFMETNSLSLVYEEAVRPAVCSLV
nr:hypothetical protein [Faecalibaculum rodentium]